VCVCVCVCVCVIKCFIFVEVCVMFVRILLSVKGGIVDYYFVSVSSVYQLKYAIQY
jgi:hypothetical protein